MACNVCDTCDACRALDPAMLAARARHSAYAVHATPTALRHRLLRLLAGNAVRLSQFRPLPGSLLRAGHERDVPACSDGSPSAPHGTVRASAGQSQSQPILCAPPRLGCVGVVPRTARRVRGLALHQPSKGRADVGSLCCLRATWRSHSLHHAVHLPCVGASTPRDSSRLRRLFLPRTGPSGRPLGCSECSSSARRVGAVPQTARRGRSLLCTGTSLVAFRAERAGRPVRCGRLFCMRSLGRSCAVWHVRLGSFGVA